MDPHLSTQCKKHQSLVRDSSSWSVCRDALSVLLTHKWFCQPATAVRSHRGIAMLASPHAPQMHWPKLTRSFFAGGPSFAWLSSFIGVHKAKKGPKAKMPKAKEPTTKGHAGTCNVLCHVSVQDNCKLSTLHKTGSCRAHEFLLCIYICLRWKNMMAVDTLLPLLAVGRSREA